MKRRLLSAFLAVMMVLTMAPVAFAADDVVAKIGDISYSTLADAVVHAKTGDTIVMQSATDISKTGLKITSGKDITLDLNGHEVKAANTQAGNIQVAGKMTLKDSTDTNANGEGEGKITTSSTYVYGSTDKVLVTALDGEFVMESGLIDAATNITDNKNNGQFAVGVENQNKNASVTINGGKIKAGWYAVAGNGGYTSYSGDITVNGGILESTTDYAIYNPQKGTTTINGGVIYGQAGGISIKRGTLVVNDGTITSKGVGNTGSWGDGTGNLNNAAIQSKKRYDTVTVLVKGGKVIAEGDAVTIDTDAEHPATVAVTGGTFSSDISKYCEKNYYTEQNADNTYTVKSLKDVAVAQVGGTYYKTLAEAVAAAKDGGTIDLLSNVSERLWIKNNEDVTINLNGHTISSEKQTANVRHGKLTVNGPGTIKEDEPYFGALLIKGSTNQSDTDYAVATINKNVTLEGWAPVFIDQFDDKENTGKAYGITVNLNGAVLNGKKDSTGDLGSGIYVNGTIKDATNAPVINLDSTTVTSEGHGMYLAGYATTTVNGGSVSGSETGIEIRAGKLTVNGATVTGNGIPTSVTPNGNGSTSVGAGIAVAQHTTELPIDVTISDGMISGYTGLLERNPQNNPAASIARVNINVAGGKFAAINGGKNAVSSDDKRVIISGGDFSSDPSGYLAVSAEGQKYVAGAINESPYFFRVALVENNQIPVVPAVGETAAPSAKELKKNGMTEEAANAVAAAAQKVAAGDTEIKEAVAPIATGITDEKAAKYQQAAANDVDAVEKIEVRAYLEVKPTAYNGSAYTLDITPKYDVVVVGTKNGATAKKVVETNTLNVTKATVVTMELPAGFAVANGAKLSIQHTKSNGTVEYYTGTVTEQSGKHLLTFTTNGFSPFVISVPAASIGENVYPTLQAAVDSVESGKTIKLERAVAADTKVTVAKSINFKIDTNGKTFNAAKNIVAGSNTTVKVTGESSPYTYEFTYTKPSSGGSSGKTTYKVTTSAVNNGGVNASPSSAEKGATITITLSPDKGYKLDKLTITDGSGKTVSTVKKSDTVYTFTMPASAVNVGVSYVKATETPSETKFNDVSANDWFASAVDYVTGKGMMNGTADNTFSPKANTTRGMVVTVLYRLENQPSTSAASFTDVASGAYYANAVAWANANGIVSGYGSGKFGPNDKVTREQLAAILYRYAQYKKYDVSVGEDTNILSYDDAQSISSYAIPAIQWACGAGVVTGKSGSKLDPKGNATRAEVAAMLMRFCENVK